MTDDIIPRKRSQWTPTEEHSHKWFFLQTRNVFEEVHAEGDTRYRQADYAYFVCNGCPDTGYQPNVIKREVRGKE